VNYTPSKRQVEQWQKAGEQYQPTMRRILAANSKYWRAWFDNRRQEKANERINPFE
jgi:hypothetical protein